MPPIAHQVTCAIGGQKDIANRAVPLSVSGTVRTAYNRTVLHNAFKSFLPRVDSFDIKVLDGGLSETRHKFKCCVNGKYYVACMLSDILPEREKEVRSHILAAQQGCAPTIYYHDADYSLVIMDFMPGRTISLQELAMPIVLDQCVCAVKAIENFKIGMPPHDIFERIKGCYASLLEQQVEFPYPLAKAMEFIDRVQKKINQQQRPLVFCHNDLHPRNIFFTNQKISIIDWECANISYAMYDLAKFSVYSCLDDKADLYLLTRYLEQEPSEQDLSYFKWIKLVARLTDALVILSYLDGLKHLLATHNTTGLKDYEHYQRLYADAITENSSPEFLFALGLSQLKEFFKGMDTTSLS